MAMALDSRLAKAPAVVPLGLAEDEELHILSKATDKGHEILLFIREGSMQVAFGLVGAVGGGLWQTWKRLFSLCFH